MASADKAALLLACVAGFVVLVAVVVTWMGRR